MAKFIVREASGEFYKTIEANSLPHAMLEAKELGLVGFHVEPAPVAEMFANPDWADDINSTMSRFHY